MSYVSGSADVLEALGVRSLGAFAHLPGEAVAERLGPEGKRAWSLARGGERRRVAGRGQRATSMARSPVGAPLVFASAAAYQVKNVPPIAAR